MADFDDLIAAFGRAGNAFANFDTTIFDELLKTMKPPSHPNCKSTITFTVDPMAIDLGKSKAPPYTLTEHNQLKRVLAAGDAGPVEFARLLDAIEQAWGDLHALEKRIDDVIAKNKRDILAVLIDRSGLEYDIDASQVGNKYNSLFNKDPRQQPPSTIYIPEAPSFKGSSTVFDESTKAKTNVTRTFKREARRASDGAIIYREVP